MEIYQNQSLREFDRLNREIERFYHEISVRIGLSDSAFFILRCILDLGEGCSQKDICEFACLNKQTVNSSVRKLKDDGFLLFQPGKKREVQIFFTDSGKRLVEEKIRPIMEAESSVFDEMTEEERNEMVRLTELYLIEFKKKIDKTL